ncbi:MAG: ankyrin repeat domain-containing protein [Candidatus Anstonellales archaeon]
MEVKGKDKEKEGSTSKETTKEGKEGIGVEGKVEGRRIGDEEVFRRVLRSVRSGAEDKEAFEELRRINKERREEIGEIKANYLGENLMQECRSYPHSVEKVLRLILEGANLDVQAEDGRTALMGAVYWNSKEIVKILLKVGVKLDVKDKWKSTALMDAAKNRASREIVEMLLEAGADPFIVGGGGWTAYGLAKDEEIKEIIRIYEAEALVKKTEKGEKLTEEEMEIVLMGLKYMLKDCNKRAAGIIVRKMLV